MRSISQYLKVLLSSQPILKIIHMLLMTFLGMISIIVIIGNGIGNWSFQTLDEADVFHFV